MSKIEKVVLAYSGGLDTSIILKWLKINYNCDVITMTADLGQGEEMDGIEDKRLNQLGSAIAFGHPLASSGGRLVAHLAKLFELNPKAKYGITTLCVGLGMGAATIWENVSN